MTYPFKFRFVFDSFFFDDIKNNYDLHSKLTKINLRSQYNKRKQNIISERSRGLIARKYEKLSIETLRMFLKRISEPEEIEGIVDEILRTIKYAIHLKSQRPNKVIIFTNDQKKEEYLRHEHLEEVVNIIIKSGQEAIDYLEQCFEISKPGMLGTCD